MNMSLSTRLRVGFYRVRGTYHQTVSFIFERRDFTEFREFYEKLFNREDIIYMFFTTDLLHWLNRALEFVPDDANVVLIGSDLTPEEIAWVRARSARPFHHVRSRVDDNTVLDFIFKLTRHNFGWLHIDCFVLNPSLFQEMRTIADDVVANCIWSHPATGQSHALHSAFVFLNYKVMETVRRKGIEVSPLAYHYRGGHTGRTMADRKLYSRVPTSRQVELLLEVLPEDPYTGLAKYPQGGSYFQILVLYQLVANALGYKLHHVRELVRDGTGSPSSYSNEIIHVNGVATYKSYRETDQSIGGQFYSLLLQADYHMLSIMGDQVPARYSDLRRELEQELQRLGMSEHETKRNLFGFLVQRGITEDKCREILGL